MFSDLLLRSHPYALEFVRQFNLKMNKVGKEQNQLP